jgi:nitrate/nitrite transport system ATP-binding protein
VPIERPRDRAALNHNPVFKKVRAEIIDFLLQCKARETTKVTRKLILPDIEPENIETIGLFDRISPRRGPIRRSEIKKEPIPV